jgi:hypothetical protein
MNRAFLEQLLVQAEQHVALGERHIARQREIVAELERDGHDTTQAKELLAVFLATQATHVVGRDRLMEELKPKLG